MGTGRSLREAGQTRVLVRGLGGIAVRILLAKVTPLGITTVRSGAAPGAGNVRLLLAAIARMDQESRRMT